MIHTKLTYLKVQVYYLRNKEVTELSAWLYLVLHNFCQAAVLDP